MLDNILISTKDYIAKKSIQCRQRTILLKYDYNANKGLQGASKVK
jgi:hypothetical protein